MVIRHTTMRVTSLPMGRLGNAIFRYLATVLFKIVYNAKIINYDKVVTNEKFLLVKDDLFITWMQGLLAGHNMYLDDDTTYGFLGFFQHDEIYLKYRPAILEHIRNNPNDLLITDGHTIERPDFDYAPTQYSASSLLNPQIPLKKTYDTVVHLRLEDFIRYGFVIHPQSVKLLLESIGAPLYCFVVNLPKTDLEMQYIEYLTKHFNIVIESNDIITDFHIMRNAKTLVCSNSTVSWAAAFFSDTVQCVYMPNYPAKRPHETFRKPISNTITYDYKTCSKEELEAFLRVA